MTLSIQPYKSKVKPETLWSPAILCFNLGSSYLPTYLSYPPAIWVARWRLNSPDGIVLSIDPHTTPLIFPSQSLLLSCEYIKTSCTITNCQKDAARWPMDLAMLCLFPSSQHPCTRLEFALHRALFLTLHWHSHHVHYSAMSWAWLEQSTLHSFPYTAWGSPRREVGDL